MGRPIDGADSAAAAGHDCRMVSMRRVHVDERISRAPNRAALVQPVNALWAPSQSLSRMAALGHAHAARAYSSQDATPKDVGGSRPPAGTLGGGATGAVGAVEEPGGAGISGIVLGLEPKGAVGGLTWMVGGGVLDGVHDDGSLLRLLHALSGQQQPATSRQVETSR